MQKMEVEHIGNNVISIFWALFPPSAMSMSKGVELTQALNVEVNFYEVYVLLLIF